MAPLVGRFRIDPNAAGANAPRLALRLLGEAIGARRVVLLWLNHEGQFERAPVQWTRDGSIVPLEMGRAHECTASGEIHHFRDSGSPQEPQTDALYVPLFVGAEALGALVVDSEPGVAFDGNSIATLVTFGSQLALAMDNDSLIFNLRASVERAEAANRAKSEFLANVSHEIRTPMTAILGYLELMEDPETSNELRTELGDGVRCSGDHLLDVVNDIVDISRIEAGKIALKFSQLSPRDICEDVRAIFRGQATQKGLTFDVACPEERAPCVETDRKRLRQILVNLVGNAIKFTESGFVQVYVEVQRGRDRDERLLITVSDSGIGMGDDTQLRIFEPYVQGDPTTTRKFGGTGLGLAIARRLVELLGGSISVESTRGEGTLFAVTLPMTPPDGLVCSAEDRTPQTPVSRGADAVPEILSGRILLAEDGHDNQKVIEHFLTRAGLQVEIAENGKLAYDMAVATHDSGSPYDLILMDIDMPVLDGYQVTSMLRRAGFTKPIIALTAHALSGDRERCLQAGCNDYTTKPIRRKLLLSVLARHLGQSKPEA
jgi:signal transduction histidine kinase/CheY-like chemotaxis protein